MRARRAIAVLAVPAVACLMLIGAPVAGHGEDTAFVTNPVEHVTTLIGTGTGGEEAGEIDNFPGAAVPFGMVQYSPDTTDTYAGYDHDNERSTGFSMTHAIAEPTNIGTIGRPVRVSSRWRTRGHAWLICLASGGTRHRRETDPSQMSR